MTLPILQTIKTQKIQITKNYFNSKVQFLNLFKKIINRQFLNLKIRRRKNNHFFSNN